MADKRTSKQIEFHHGNGVNSWGGGISRGGQSGRPLNGHLSVAFFISGAFVSVPHAAR